MHRGGYTVVALGEWLGLIEGWLDGFVASNGLVLVDADEGAPGALKSCGFSDGLTLSRCPRLAITHHDPAPWAELSPDIWCGIPPEPVPASGGGLPARA